MSKKEQTKEQIQEQAEEQVQEQAEGKKEYIAPEVAINPTSLPEVAEALMEELKVDEIHKAGCYWFKKLGEAEDWAKQNGCKVESYKR